MRIGYSMWGFLGHGIVDTPDGSRAYRRSFIDGLIAAGHAVVFLQPDRDLTEARQTPWGRYRWDPGFPDLDAVIYEWRWPLPGRNTTDCDAIGHTCDLHRQIDLFDHYTEAGTPTLIWDLDRQLPGDDPRRLLTNVMVGEFALTPTPGAVSLPCPVPDALLDTADPKLLASLSRPLPLVYVGNQYDRDEAFDRYFAPAAARVPHQVAGKWTRTQRWPHVRFTGRCGFTQVETLHRHALATVLLLPDRYAHAGHMTSRWFEALLAGCLPLTPAEIRFADAYAPRNLQVTTSEDVIDKITWIQSIAGSAEHADLIAGCLPLLEPFRCSTQVAAALTVLEGLS
ncbi:hypothetical protein [Mangrovihabitans endophyticus]|uniref:Uncharacterized protein n=1 Tax=Mangrovihabitans endophyticus TaxID=1751298 RepID=A0A8J3FQE2_9ACTN|nr:hypothetical protein [Mangrovihabitans endophyticus]GGL06861.1 hypothetical protein GCM10012284_46290 [Mangrovihabitans endophyticus]